MAHGIEVNWIWNVLFDKYKNYFAWQIYTALGACTATAALSQLYLFQFSSNNGKRWRIAVKITSVGFHENSFGSSYIVSCLQTDRWLYEVILSDVPQWCDRAKNWKRHVIYVLTLRGGCVTTVAVKTVLNILCVCVCVFSLRYPPCNAHAPYCHLWPARLYNTFPHYLINGTILGGKKLLNIKCLSWFSLQLFSGTFLIVILARYYYKCTVQGLHAKFPLLWSDFDKTWTSLIDFIKIFKYQISRKSVQLEPSCSVRTNGRTDRHNEFNSRFSQFSANT